MSAQVPLTPLQMFSDDLDRLVHRARLEYDGLTYADIVAACQFKQFELMCELKLSFRPPTPGGNESDG